MRVLFVHFPMDNDQIEGTSFPSFFARTGHEVFCTFHKRDRNFDYKILNDGTIREIAPEEILFQEFDLLIAKGSASSSYNQKLFKSSKFKVNVLTLGIPQNKLGYDFCFEDGDLVKPPVSQMFSFFMENSGKYKKENLIVCPASIGTDKNQIEFLNLVDSSLVKDFQLLFCGKIASKSYAESMQSIAKKKNLNVIIKDTIPKIEVAQIMIRSKVLALTTDPRPAQPYDPSPRVIPETLCAGTPFFINDLVLTDPNVRNLGWIYRNGDETDFNNKLEQALHGWEKKSLDAQLFSREYYQMETACKRMQDKIFREMKK